MERGSCLACVPAFQMFGGIPQKCDLQNRPLLCSLHIFIPTWYKRCSKHRDKCDKCDKWGGHRRAGAQGGSVQRLLATKTGHKMWGRDLSAHGAAGHTSPAVTPAFWVSAPAPAAHPCLLRSPEMSLERPPQPGQAVGMGAGSCQPLLSGWWALPPWSELLRFLELGGFPTFTGLLRAVWVSFPVWIWFAFGRLCPCSSQLRTFSLIFLISEWVEHYL